MTGLIYIRDVATLELDRAKCSGCRMCMTVCPHSVFAASNGKVRIVEPDLCIECGACVMNCPEGALKVTPGVGCAAAILKGWITRSGSPCC